MIPKDWFQRILFAAFLCFFAASCIAPPYPDFLLMQHAPTLLAAFSLGYFSNRFAFSRLSYTAIILFLALHTLGARYLYSYVPYDRWSLQLIGVSVSEVFGFERNHYDRLVHFSYGLLMVVPIQDFERRHLGLSATLSSVLAFECIVATSGLYEVIEWLVAVIFTPDWAEAFLGQQGDAFDAQKDMALAMLGACISLGVLAILRPRAKASTLR